MHFGSRNSTTPRTLNQIQTIMSRSGPSSGSNRRLQSRSPTARNRRSGTCPICLEDLDGRETWSCLQCEALIHVECMPRNLQTGHIHLENGCPLCRTTMDDPLRIAGRSQAAPHGAMCYVCWQPIAFGASMHSCAAPRRHCIATWHEECGRRQCPGCGLSVYRALVMRQGRQNSE